MSEGEKSLTGGNLIEMFPGQTLKPGSKEKIHHTMSDAVMTELKAELEKAMRRLKVRANIRE